MTQECTLHISLKVAETINEEKTKHNDTTIRFLEKEGEGNGGGATVLTYHCSQDPGVTMMKGVGSQRILSMDWVKGLTPPASCGCLLWLNLNVHSADKPSQAGPFLWA